jgi:PAS domain S-box-containing protein
LHEKKFFVQAPKHSLKSYLISGIIFLEALVKNYSNIHILNRDTDHPFLNQVHNSDERFRSLLDEAPFSTALLVGSDFVIEQANEISLKLWGKDDRIIGKRLLDVVPEMNTRPLHDELKKVYDTGITYEGKEIATFFDAGGERKKVYVNITYKALRDEEGNINAILYTGYDVTGHVVVRKKLFESEERSRLAVEATGLGTFDYNYATKLIITSPRMNAIFGFKEQQVFEKYVDAIHPEDQPVRTIAHMRATDTGWLDYEVRLIMPDKTIKWVRIKGKISFNTDHQPIRLLGTALDTTERREARKKLEESELRFRTLITETPEVASGLYIGPDHQIQYVNNVMLRFWGKDTSVIGKTFREAVPELEGQPFFEQLDKVYATGEAFTGKEVEAILIVNGVRKPAYFNYTYKALRDEDGVIYGIHHMAVDVTDQVLNKLKYIESERKFRQLITQAPFGIAIVKGDNFFTEYANDAYLQLIGRTRQEFIGRPLWEGLPEVESQVFDKLLQEVMHTGIPFHGKEYPAKIYRHGEMQNIFVDFTYEPLKSEDGKIDGIMVLSVDVTDKVLGRREIEKSRDLFNSILETLPQIAWTTNANGVVNYINQQWSNYTGQPLSVALGNGLAKVLLPEEAEDFVSTWRKNTRESTFFERECRVRRHDGKYRWHLVRGVPIYDNDGNKTMWVGTSTDIHDQKLFSEELEHKIKERTKELERSNSELEQFAYISSHDLQEPLRKIITYCGMLTESLGEISEKSNMLLNKILNSSERMSKLIKDILDFSSLSKAPKAYRQVNLNLILANVINDFDLLIEQKKATIETEILGVIEAVPLQINQLFYNLMSNSLKFAAPNRDAIINVRTRQVAPHEISQYKNLNPSLPYIQLEWQDNGIGFSEKYAQQIFVIFQRLHDRQAYSGTGIGLAICKRILANHNGEIFVKSKVNEGTTFYILLPLRQETSF